MRRERLGKLTITESDKRIYIHYNLFDLDYKERWSALEGRQTRISLIAVGVWISGGFSRYPRLLVYTTGPVTTWDEAFAPAMLLHLEAERVMHDMRRCTE